jgi:hypothetical protein
MRTRHSLLVLATVSLAILLTGCQKPDAESAPQTTSPAGQSARTGDDVTLHLYPSTFSTSTLVAAFADAGLRVRVQPAEGERMFGPGAHRQTLSIGQARVLVFVFADESVAEKAAAGVSADGSTIPRVSRSGVEEGLTNYEWTGPPHLYARGRVLVLFVESGPRSVGQPTNEQDERVIEVLESAMGSQFAGA